MLTDTRERERRFSNELVTQIPSLSASLHTREKEADMILLKTTLETTRQLSDFKDASIRFLSSLLSSSLVFHVKSETYTLLAYSHFLSFTFHFS